MARRRRTQARSDVQGPATRRLGSALRVWASSRSALVQTIRSWQAAAADAALFAVSAATRDATGRGRIRDGVHRLQNSHAPVGRLTLVALGRRRRCHRSADAGRPAAHDSFGRDRSPPVGPAPKPARSVSHEQRGRRPWHGCSLGEAGITSVPTTPRPTTASGQKQRPCSSARSHISPRALFFFVRPARCDCIGDETHLRDGVVNRVRASATRARCRRCRHSRPASPASRCLRCGRLENPQFPDGRSGTTGRVRESALRRWYPASHEGPPYPRDAGLRARSPRYPCDNKSRSPPAMVNRTRTDCPTPEPEV